MTTWKKAVSTLATAGLLASLLATTVVGTASAAVVMSPTSGTNLGGTVVSITGASGLTVSATATACGLPVSVTSVSPDGTSMTFVTADVSPFTGLCVVTVDPDGAGPAAALVGLPGFFATSGLPGPVTLTPNNGKDATVVSLAAPGQYIATTAVTLTVGGAGVAFIRNSGETATFAIPTLLCSAQPTLPVTLAVTMTGIVGIPGFTCNSLANKFTMVPTSGPTGTVVQLSYDPGTFDLGCRVNLAGGPVGIAPTSVAADGSKLTFVIPTGTAAATYAVSTTLCVTTNGGAGNFIVSSAGAGGNVTPASVSNAGGTVVQVTQSTGGLTTLSTVSLSALSGGPVCYGAILPTSVAADGKSLTFVMPAEKFVTNVAPGTGACPLASHVAFVWITGAAANAGSVTYAQPAGPPVVTSVSPNTGSRLGGNTVTITGSAFVSGATVGFGAALATSVTFVSATSLTAVVPAGVGVVPVIVRNPDAQSGQLPSGYTYTDTGYVCGNATALGVTTSGPFTTSTKVAALNGQVTYAMGCGVAAAGQIITIQRSVQTPASGGGTWSAFTPFTSRIANSGGTVYFYVRSSSAAWWSFRASIASVVSPARQTRWR